MTDETHELREVVSAFERAGYHAAAEALRKRLRAIEHKVDPEAIARKLEASPRPEEAARDAFERTYSNAAWGFKRSRRGTYVNPSVARDWKYFLAGWLARR